jgi:hypothetical protein
MPSPYSDRSAGISGERDATESDRNSRLRGPPRGPPRPLPNSVETHADDRDRAIRIGGVAIAERDRVRRERPPGGSRRFPAIKVIDGDDVTVSDVAGSADARQELAIRRKCDLGHLRQLTIRPPQRERSPSERNGPQGQRSVGSPHRELRSVRRECDGRVRRRTVAGRRDGARASRAYVPELRAGSGSPGAGDEQVTATRGECTGNHRRQGGVQRQQHPMALPIPDAHAIATHRREMSVVRECQRRRRARTAQYGSQRRVSGRLPKGAFGLIRRSSVVGAERESQSKQRCG